MEEQQLQQFVKRVSRDAALREELKSHPADVIVREGFSPRLTRVVMQLVPHLTLTQDFALDCSWWRC
ncbi:Nif11 family protein [Ktedonosporobacter rubrisoli]|uniref:Nif11 family protein n=1 Tax=Ktedonosporobacter rubrisoli TaxID=2509675 RepID=A0A4P6K3W7_KTERU|nr:Nif11 family protein [Ktedonosporobacter rubrisoli]QBD82196.1 Nif11 family protein [Ktedonosporobacter rubrisoli]